MAQSVMKKDGDGGRNKFWISKEEVQQSKREGMEIRPSAETRTACRPEHELKKARRVPLLDRIGNDWTG